MELKVKTTNCAVCGNEHFEDELSTVKVSGFQSPMKLCAACISKTPYDSFREATDILAAIASMASHESNMSPEVRVAMIRKLLG